jgi:hypothetical protein
MATIEKSSQQAEPAVAAPTQTPANPAPDDGYKVGPGRPPREHQWPPGVSGNRKGAKRKAPNLAPDLKKLLAQVLERKITITQGERKRTFTLFAAGIEQLVKQYVKGDRHARKELFELAEKVGLDLLGIQKKALEEALTESHQAMLYDYVAKQYDLVAARAAVLAPPELLDDDVDDQTRH